ncbi:Uncharacterized protein DBV15_06440 [Temnothorax longispinosus]|uniref:G-protein coupled receptors family 1 profile domain-containing protein n=1 Tax=Temnothorax longispinosus TaxID=300112 RepID=A0A4V3SB37_9HYME|nr:Uncharacterized protein DBV15_06440 [Temnothorax longispinosus]
MLTYSYPGIHRWSQGLLFHQAMVDCARAAILLPLGSSILNCQPVNKCSLVETAFLLLVTVSTVNMLTTVLNDSPVFPESDEEADLTAPLLMDSPQCVLFGTFMIWFASITINLGPTFLSGALAANTESGHNTPSCPLIHGPFRHYILNALWIVINIICVALTLFHLRKLHRDLTKANVEAVRVAGLVTTLVNVTGGHQGATNALATEDGDTRNENGCHRGTPENEELPQENGTRGCAEGENVPGYNSGVRLVLGTIVFRYPGASSRYRKPYWLRAARCKLCIASKSLDSAVLLYQVTLHIAYVHAFVNPALFLALHRGLRQGMTDVCCGCCESIARWILGPAAAGPMQNVQLPRYEPPMNLPSPPDPPLAAPTVPSGCNLTDVALLKPPLPPTAKHLLVDDSIVIPPDPWSLTSRPKSTSSLYGEELSRRPSLLLPPPAELNDLQMSPTSSDFPSE